MFLTCRAPRCPIKPALVNDVVERGCRRAGVERFGPHRMRHALAGQLLRRGVGLTAISQVLRHQDLATTAVYAKGGPGRLASGRAALAGGDPVSTLEHSLADYLTLRRGLGHQMADAARLLPSFVAYLDARGVSTVTVQAALDWCQQPAPVGGITVAPRRMTAVRGFARYLSGIDPTTEVPPTGLVPFRRQRPAPFIYSDADVAALLSVACQLGEDPLRNLTYSTLIGLLATTGLRVGEAIKLDLGDIDHTDAVLLIRESKFGKSRLVPVQPSTLTAIEHYHAIRRTGRRGRRQPSLFISRTGRRLVYQVVCQTFRRIVTEAGVGAGAARPPRLHDLRHRFAVVTLLDWYRAGEDVQAKLPALSTYLGHREPAYTYWYLTAIPELLALAVARQRRSSWLDQRR